ncbi:hypothetical protein LCGC14_0652170 [marine sediment metagenome]|uniref:50S ribosomal protein L29 n=1 Tax=marine sediment metagenome TaxID=412755 RepID=A0A0F9R195_9ZZZZ
MKQKGKNELRSLSADKLNSLKSGLTIQLMSASHKTQKFGFSPPMGTQTKSVSDLRKQIARINTFITEKNDNQNK